MPCCGFPRNLVSFDFGLAPLALLPCGTKCCPAEKVLPWLKKLGTENLAPCFTKLGTDSIPEFIYDGTCLSVNAVGKASAPSVACGNEGGGDTLDVHVLVSGVVGCVEAVGMVPDIV